MQMYAYGEIDDGSIDDDAESKRQHQIERAAKREALLPFEISNFPLNFTTSKAYRISGRSGLSLTRNGVAECLKVVPIRRFATTLAIRCGEQGKLVEHRCIGCFLYFVIHDLTASVKRACC
jgi:hypothetical protein